MIEWRIAEANFPFCFFRSIQVIENEVANGACERQVFLLAKDFGRFTKGARCKSRRHDGGCTARRKEGPRLPVKVVTPGSALESFQAHPHQIVQQLSRFELCFFGLTAPVFSQRRQREEGDAFCISFARNADERAKVYRRALVKLRPGEPRDSRVPERCGLKPPAVQRVIRIIAGETLRAAPLPEAFVRACKINRHFWSLTAK